MEGKNEGYFHSVVKKNVIFLNFVLFVTFVSIFKFETNILDCFLILNKSSLIYIIW